MKYSILISILRFIITVGMACLIIFLLLKLWPNTQKSGYSVWYEIKLVSVNGSRSLILIVLATLFSIAFTAFSLLFSTRFRHPRPISMGVKSCIYVLSAIPTVFASYLALRFFQQFFGVSLYCIGNDAKGLQYYVIPALVLGVGDGLLNEFIHHAEAELNVIRQANYVKMAKSIGAKMWPYIRNDFVVHSSRVLFSRITALISGAIVVEFIFRIPGLGWLAFDAAEKRYTSRLMLVLLCMVITVSLLNLIYRVMAVALDPRLR